MPDRFQLPHTTNRGNQHEQDTDPAAFTLAFGTASLTVSAATIPTFPMTITAGVTTYDSDGYAANVASGSWFAVDTNGNSLIAGTGKNSLSQGYWGLVMGAITNPGASRPLPVISMTPPRPGYSLATRDRIPHRPYIRQHDHGLGFQRLDRYLERNPRH